MDKLWIENSWTNDIMKDWTNEHLGKN